MNNRIFSFTDQSIHEVQNIVAVGAGLVADSRVVIDQRIAQSHEPIHGEWERRTFAPKSYRWVHEWRRGR